VPVLPGDGASAAEEARDTLDEDEEVVRRLTGALWGKYERNFMHFIDDAIEGWRLEGRTFPSERAKAEAIGRLVLGTREEVARDPLGWVRAHCDR
jgi:hypothetical protein